jgi:hypothetical protein
MRMVLAQASPEHPSNGEMPARKALELAPAALAYRCHRRSSTVRCTRSLILPANTQNKFFLVSLSIEIHVMTRVEILCAPNNTLMKIRKAK